MYDQIKSLVEKKVAADAKALELNSQFVESFSKRNSAFVAAAFESVLSAAQQAGKVTSIGDVIEKQVALGETFKSQLVSLAEQNGAEAKKLQESLADLYAFAIPAVPAAKAKKAA
jgi:hypothetical protein